MTLPAETPTPPNPPDLPLRTQLCFDAALPVSYADEPRVVFYMDGRSEPPCVVLRNPQFSNMIANFFSPGEASQGIGDGRDRLSSRLLVSLNPSLTSNIGEIHQVGREVCELGRASRSTCRHYLSSGRPEGSSRRCLVSTTFSVCTERVH